MKKLFSNSFLPIFLLILISVLSHIVWFDPFAVLTNGDVWFLYKEAMLTSNWGTWVSLLSPGGVNVNYNFFLLTSFWQFIAKSGFDNQVANQILYFFPVIFITPIAGYAYFYYLTNSRISAFIAALFYMFPTFFLMSQNAGMLYALSHTFIPLNFLFFERYLRFQKTTDGILTILFFSLFLAYEIRIAYIVGLVLLLYAIFTFIIQYKRQFLKKFLIFIWKAKYLLLLLLLINFYIYFPTLATSVKDTTAVITSRTLFGADFFTIKEPLVLMHPFWSGKVPTEFVPQPIPFYFWVFPLYAFLAFYFVKKDNKIVFFALIAVLMVFLGKSSSEPWGHIYLWLYNHFPGFAFYREPSKFWPMIAFTYAVLIAYSTYFVPKYLYSKFRDYRYKATVILFYSLIIVVSLWVGKPAFTKELGPFFNNLQVTKEHYLFKDFLYSQKEFFRTLYVPNIYRMGFASEIHPMLGLYGLPNYFQTMDSRILSLLSIKYVVLPADITNDVYRGWGYRADFENILDKETNLKKITNPLFGEFSVYENRSPYMPHIYTTSDTTYVVGESDTFLHILSLMDSAPSAVYFAQKTTTANDAINKQFYSTSDTIFSTAKCVRCDYGDYTSGFYFPFARFLPDSPFYGYITGKETKLLKTLDVDRNAQLKQTLFFSLKRLLEVQRIVEQGIHPEFAKTSILGERKLLEAVSAEIDTLLKSPQDNDYLLSIYDTLSVEAEIISNIFINADITDANKGLLRNNQDILHEQIKKIEAAIWMSDYSHKKYFVTPPSEGRYEMYVQDVGSDSAKLVVDDQEFLLANSDKEGWLTAGETVLTANTHKVMVEGLDKNYTTQESLILDNIRDSKVKEIVIPLEELEGNTEYIISFNYKISKNINTRFSVDREFDYIQNGYIRRAFDQSLIADNNWQVVKGRFTTRFNEKKASLTFIMDMNQQNNNNFVLDKISVLKSKGPQFILKKVDNNKEIINDQPKITFQSINPTKYIVHIKDAKKPFYLVFSETFDPGWQAVYTDEKLLVSDKAASYKNEQIVELAGKNDANLLSFLSLFKKDQIIAEHTPINGYANAWHVDKEGTYTITIEYAPQRIFMLSLFISALAFITAIVIYIFILIKNEKNKNSK